ncbi:hypothetical protein GCM10025734_62150 [Kitasatospora paranensis]
MQLGGGGDQGQSVEIDRLTPLVTGGMQLESLFVRRWMDEDCYTACDATTDCTPELVADTRRDGSDVEVRRDLQEPAGQGTAYVVGDGGNGEDGHRRHRGSRMNAVEADGSALTVALPARS